MNLLQEALRLDICKDYLKAIEIYELINEGVNAPIESFTNLSFIYWEFAAEFAFRDENNISKKWAEIGGKRYVSVLEKGLSKYPYSLELHFWYRYFPHRLYFDDFSKDECMELIKKFGNNESVVPYFYLYLFDREKFKNKRDILLIECEQKPTAKNNYIRSIIE
jgi:hypothetical protein